MMYAKLKGSVGQYKIELDLYDQLVLVEGNSGIGKSLVFQYFNRLSADKEKDRYSCINSKSINSMSNLLRKNDEQLIANILQESKNKYIFIDNADTILTPKLRDYIANDIHNRYILFGRNVEGLWINENRDAELIKDTKNKKFVLYYRFKRENLNARVVD